MRATLVFTAALLAGVCFFTCTADAEPAPSWLHPGPHASYDGRYDHLVTGRLGATGMLGNPPGYADPLHPTAVELRRAALYLRGSTGQGFGRLFGPGVDHATGQVLPDDGKIAGEEYLAYADDGEGRQNVAMLLQVPAALSSQRRCLVALPVNGSAGLYRDVVDFGYWGLRRGCAVVYTDKGHGNGFHMLEPDTVNLLDGRQVPAAATAPGCAILR